MKRQGLPIWGGSVSLASIIFNSLLLMRQIMVVISALVILVGGSSLRGGSNIKNKQAAEAARLLTSN